jgi:hypothetical protein
MGTATSYRGTQLDQGLKMANEIQCACGGARVSGARGQMSYSSPSIGVARDFLCGVHHRATFFLASLAQ